MKHFFFIIENKYNVCKQKDKKGVFNFMARAPVVMNCVLPSGLIT